MSDVIITHYHADHSEGLLQLRHEFGPGLRAWKLDPAYKGPHGPSFDLVAHKARRGRSMRRAADVTFRGDGKLKPS